MLSTIKLPRKYLFFKNNNFLGNHIPQILHTKAKLLFFGGIEISHTFAK
jgi:hypothetical protein